jgi:hypothetical protein
MDSNTHSTRSPGGLIGLAAVVDGLAAQDRAGLPDAVRAERVLALRRLLDRLEGRWLAALATLDAAGAAGAEHGVQAGSTASWLRARLRMGAGAASRAVRTARALFGGPLTQTAQALRDGELSAAHAAVLTAGTHHLPDQVTVEAEPVLVEAARRLDPGRLRRVLGHLQLVDAPDRNLPATVEETVAEPWPVPPDRPGTSNSLAGRASTGFAWAMTTMAVFRVRARATARRARAALPGRGPAGG